MDCNHDDLMRAIGNLEGTVKTGFESVNGLLEKHDRSIDALNSYKDQGLGKQTIIASIAAAVFGIVGSSLWTTFFHAK